MTPPPLFFEVVPAAATHPPSHMSLQPALPDLGEPGRLHSPYIDLRQSWGRELWLLFFFFLLHFLLITGHTRENG